MYAIFVSILGGSLVLAILAIAYLIEERRDARRDARRDQAAWHAEVTTRLDEHEWQQRMIEQQVTTTVAMTGATTRLDLSGMPQKGTCGKHDESTRNH